MVYRTKVKYVVASALLGAALFLAADSGVRAQAGQQAPQRSKMTAADRQAAAQRAAAARLAANPNAQADTRAADAGLTPIVGCPPAVMAAPLSTPDYMGGCIPNWANSPFPVPSLTVPVTYTGGIRKFVDTLPGLGVGGKNNLGQYLPVGIPDTTTYPGSDYYEISLVEYSEQMHSDLPATKLRGYVQTNTTDTTVSVPHYLGPVIVAQRDRPVRIKFSNKLPTGTGGNLFIPVDTTVMGAGMGPNGTAYSQNRATLHLHGGATPWISDGTPHQWTTPAGEVTDYPKGVSVSNVPDMPAPGAGELTFFYSNQQSARLMFYHDHAYGLTRLNVYAGEAAGYLLQDPVEQTLVNGGTIGTTAVAAGTIPADQIPLVIQDKTFVPTDPALAAQDPTWDKTNWGGFGNLWFPHVYMPNQNPADLSGANAMGRWDYGPWFWPPMTAANVVHFEVACPTTALPTQTCPGTPNPSLVPEAFMDTMVVNGTAYPKTTVQPKAYRLRILNAGNDRFLNLQLYTADPAVLTPDGRSNTEVRMVPAVATLGYPPTWPTDGRAGGVPDPATAGPPMIQIGTEGGFLEVPATIASQPVNYNYNRRDIVVLNITDHGLLLGPAERADVIVDFSAFAGKTLILYNDAPAPVPAFDPRIDYYTGDPDQTTTGGAPTTIAGYGPNTRTIMQINVAGTAAPAFNSAGLAAAMAAAFAASQPPLPVPPNTFARIQYTSLTWTPAGALVPLTVDMQPKAIQELFELDYGRMNATLGVELPFTNFNIQTTIPLGYKDPNTEILSNNGLQLWKITHNGVDTHAIHFHLFNVQLLNRVGWDGAVRGPDANELGWKETVRMNPLEDAIVALQPVAPLMPFGVPNSSRPLDPTAAVGSTISLTNPADGNVLNTANVMTNFGWEYVWHCHLLGHEENDMMRPIEFDVTTAVPDAPSGLAGRMTTQIDLTWTDPTPAAAAWLPANQAKNEIGFRIERRNTLVDPWVAVGTALANAAAFSDITVVPNQDYYYRVIAFNASGDSLPSNEVWVPAGPLLPIITWPTPAAITFPTALSATQLNATASARIGGVLTPLAGTFVYTPASGTILNAGLAQTLSVTFTPTDLVNFLPTTATVTINVLQAPITLTWATPAGIVYGTPLSATQLNASATALIGGVVTALPGAFVYTPAAGTVLTAGTHVLSVTFTPTDTNYSPGSTTVSIVVAKATPTIVWPTPAAITYGTPLSITQLNATAQWIVGAAPAVAVAGNFVYTPGTASIQNAGTRTLSTTFTPTDTANYNTATATVSLVVNRQVAVITWPAPAPIVYGTLLSAVQLNATATGTVAGVVVVVQGQWTYNPRAGTMLAVGVNRALSVTFEGANQFQQNYTIQTVANTITVNAFVGPTAGGGWSGTIVGTDLVYNGASYPIVNGVVNFPDCTTYIVAPNGALSGPNPTPNCPPYVGVSTVIRPTINWANPAAITVGTALSATQLNATATLGVGGAVIDGTFVYTPPLGTVMNTVSTGISLRVDFTPLDQVSYSTNSRTVTIRVNVVPGTFVGPQNGGGWSGTISGTNLIYNGVSYPIINGRVTFPDCWVWVVSPSGALGGGALNTNCTPTADPNAGAAPVAPAAPVATPAAPAAVAPFVGPLNGGGWSGTISGSNLIYNGATYPIVNGRVQFPNCWTYIVAPDGALVGGAPTPNCTPTAAKAAGK